MSLITKAERPRANHRNAAVGDVVLLAENGDDRDNWRLGRIVKIHTSSDETARVADVKMGNGDVKLNRMIGNLAVLELGESSSR